MPSRMNYTPPMAVPIVTLHPFDLLTEMAACLQRERRLLQQALTEHERIMEIYRRLSSEAEANADQMWPRTEETPE